MRGLGLAALVIAALSSCDPDAARAVEACSVFCDCEPPPGLTDEQCLQQCVGDVADSIGLISDACLACIGDHRDRCLSIEVDCEDECDEGIDDNPPPPDPEPPVVVDAGVPDGF